MHRRINKSIWFLALTFGLSWGLAYSFFLIVPEPAAKKYVGVMAIGYMFAPLLATLVVQRLIFKEPLKVPLEISFKINAWFAVALLLPAVLAVAALFASGLLPDVDLSWKMEHLYERFAHQFTSAQVEAMRAQSEALPLHPFWLALIQGLIAGATINALAGFGEELGWRGLLQKELSFLGFWRSSVFIGLIWGIWHAPLIVKGHNYPQHPLQGIFYMTYFTILYAPLFAYVRTRAKSVLAAAIMHGSLNGTAGLSFMLLKGGDDLSVGILGHAGFLVLALANAVLWIYEKWFAKNPVIAGFRHFNG
ncbi:CPBP family intramembrane metalloprotease [candidate division FCPU426 bacterium]|nr:CPBP family intramembrane metalloprotease [candidate division FCPU426 bacterium]